MSPPCSVTFTLSTISFLFFFFSSRRRHTRSLCDWSSDVCSSDLADQGPGSRDQHHRFPREDPGHPDERGTRSRPRSKKIFGKVEDSKLRLFPSRVTPHASRNNRFTHPQLTINKLRKTICLKPLDFLK